MNTVPAQNAHQSKRLQQDPKNNLSRKRSQTSSSQTHPKRAKLASNFQGTSNASTSQLSSRKECTLSDCPPVVSSTSVTNIHIPTNENSEKAQTHGLSTTPEEDEDMLLGSGPPMDGSLLDSQHQNDPHHLLGVENEDTLLEEDFFLTDSPPDGTLLDLSPVPQSTHEDNPGPSSVNSDSSGSESSPIVILDDKSEPSQLISSDSDSDTN